MKKLSYLLVLGVFFLGCKSNPTGTNSELKFERISGFVQKGPFINGTQIVMNELNNNLSQTGRTFSTQIITDDGSFQLSNIALDSPFVEFSGSGFYFNEVSGELSASPLTLLALSDITNRSSVNVNLLTHLERRRVEFLIGQGKSFSEAKSTSQLEILSLFGFDIDNMETSETLNMAQNSESNAILIAVSVI